MKSFPDGRQLCEAERLDSIGRMLRSQFDQIAKAPAPRVLVDLADRLEAKATQSAVAADAAAAARSPRNA